MELQQVCQVAGRAPAALTRRDIARALLAEPATEALAGLPTLRRELFAAGNPLTAAFWESAEATLGSIQQGAAPLGGVQSWLATSGTEPLDILEEMFIWPEADEAGPVALEMHGLLVSHLESLVADGTIDPDQLATGNAAALAAHRQHQVDWLDTPLPDGRIPRDAIQDEEDEDLFAGWDDAEADAREILAALLAQVGDRPCPEPALGAAATQLREELHQDRRGTALLRAAGGVDPDDLPQDDAELWLTLAAGVISQRDEPPRDTYDLEALSAWSALQHPDWIAAAVTLAREGVGASGEVDHLARQMVTFDFGEFEDDEAWGDDLLDEADGAMSVGLGLFPVLDLWRQLGAVDHDDRLTPLGWWGIPESVDRAWQLSAPDEDR